MNYLDFSIRARDWKDGRFKVEVTDSPVDRMRAAEAEEVVYDEAALARPLHNLEHKRIRVRDLIALGEALADMLLPPAVREMLVRSMEAVGPEQGLRLRLLLDDPQVANLPWEYVYLQRGGGEKTRDGFLALDPRISLVRHEAIAIARGSVQAKRPLRIVAGLSAPSDAPGLDMAAEGEFVAAALRDVEGVEVTFVENLTVEKLEAACQGAHLFHFAGHGSFEAEDENEGFGAILLEDAEGYAYPFPAENLALTLRGAGVRVAVLGACESGRRDGVNLWSGVAPALMRAGIPGVVAMQYEIFDDSAIAFARRFYQLLAAGLSLDEAVSAGRLGVLNAGGLDDVDWGVPVLYMRSPDGIIFPEVTAEPSQAVRADIYGGDIYQVQVYALSDTGRAEDWRAFLDEKTPPYKYVSPYTARDRALFKGRQAEIERVVRHIGAQRQTVIYGPAGVGKTSLLAAGVIPVLMQRGALVVHLHEYTQPLEETIRDALAASADQIPMPISEGLTLPALVRTVCDATGGTLVLIADQFERLFEPAIDAAVRAATLESLAEALRGVDPESLRLVIVMRSEALERWAEIRQQLPDVWSEPTPIPLLSREQAGMAIKAPLAELGYPGGVSYVGSLVPRHLVPDLDDLTPEDPDQILPSHLQIVCYWLYQTASARQPPHIDEELYRELKGAEGIMASYIEKTLEAELSAQKAFARTLMEAMAYPGLGPWVLPEQLPANGSSPDQVRDVLEGLVRAELLVRRAVNGTHEYAFVGPIVVQEVRHQASPAVQRRYQAEADLERVWSAWLAHDTLASSGQLRHLAEASAHLRPGPVKALLLLRSAVARDEPPAPWLDRLRNEEGRALIRELEEPYAADLAQPSSRLTLDRAASLLGLGNGQPPPSGNGREPFGQVARSAVNHPEPSTRQTAALALTALQPYPQMALDRLRWALMDGPTGWRRWLRKGELRGALADADPDNDQLASDLSLMDRLGMWLWRVRRRLIRGRHRLAGLTVGGAIGAGIALALLRALIGIPTTNRAGVLFGIFFFYAAILGGALTLGMALAEPLLLSRAKEAGLKPVSRPRSVVLAALLGVIFFGIAHMLVALLNGLQLGRAPLVAVMGFVAGLGLSMALYAQPDAGWHLGVIRWLLRLALAALAFVLTQAVFIIAGGQRSNALAIGWAGSFYRSQFDASFRQLWPQLMERWPRYFDYLALLDAALVGLVLAIGITAGLLVAQDWLKRWRDLVNRGGD